MLKRQDVKDLDELRAHWEKAQTTPRKISRIIYYYANKYFNPANRDDIDEYLKNCNYNTYTEDDLDKMKDDD